MGLKLCRKCGVEFESGRYQICGKCTTPDVVRSRERDKARYRQDPEKVKARVRSYATNNREAVLTRGRKYYAENQTRIRETVREWVKANPEKHKENSRRWAKNNRLYRQAKLVEYKASRRGAEGRFSKEEWVSICEAGGWLCWRCLKRKPLTVDHIIPLSRGGTNWISNIQPLCRKCNSEKNVNAVSYRFPNT